MNNNFIIIAFPRFAGGKFISNCLSLSKFCCPQDTKTAEYLLINSDDYNYRIESIMRTIPPTQALMINWIEKYEFGDNQIYQTAFNQWLNGITCEHSELVEKLIAAGFYLFLTAHGGDESVRNLLKVWPNSTIIKLINHVKFSKISYSLKSVDKTSINEQAGNYCENKYNELAGPSWPSWKEFESVGYDIRNLPNYKEVTDEILSFYNWRDVDNNTFLFDVDNSIFNRTKFLMAMERLYEQLGLTDFNPILVEKFWQSYMELHVDNVDLT